MISNILTHDHIAMFKFKICKKKGNNLQHKLVEAKEQPARFNRELLLVKLLYLTLSLFMIQRVGFLSLSSSNYTHDQPYYDQLSQVVYISKPTEILWA